jgi:2-keto-4-pentenoate hydratase
LALAYATQDAFVQQLATQRNTQVGGYKIAITTPAMRALVGFDDAISGCVLADRVYASGHKLRLQQFQHLIVELPTDRLYQETNTRIETTLRL